MWVFWSNFFGWTFHHPNIDPNGRSWISWWITKDYWFWIETSSTRMFEQNLDFMPRCWSVRTPRVSNLQIGTTASHDNCSTNPPMYMAPLIRLYQTLISGFTSGATLTCHSLTQSISSQIHCTTPTCCESIAVGHEGTSRSLISAPLLW